MKPSRGVAVEETDRRRGTKRGVEVRQQRAVQAGWEHLPQELSDRRIRVFNLPLEGHNEAFWMGGAGAQQLIEVDQTRWRGCPLPDLLTSVVIYDNIRHEP
ncbi:MAG: hypothetical protein F4X40_01090 [Chloroflexi bacterium]|nr:hypothetical protein [Chloroflexota bacterium]